MFKYNFRYEFISLLRNRWVVILSILLLILCVFAGYNGKQQVEQIQQDIEKAISQVEEADSLAVMYIDSVNAGYQVNLPEWKIPTDPVTVGYRYPRVTAKVPATLTSLAIGQSDIYSNHVLLKMYGDGYALNFTELSNPVQLLFGSFDVAFVLIFLLPLIVIAFTYNILSSEREQGSLRLLAAQPMTLFSWLFQKAFFRFIVLSLLLIITIAITLSINGISVFREFLPVSQFISVSLVYVLFWFTLAIFVNLLGKSSAYNAVSMLAFWVTFVLLIPAAVNQLANSLYPVPSRAQMINEVRVVKSEVEKKANEVLADFLRNHPELNTLEGEEDQASFWHRYLASQEVIKKEVQPILAKYEQQLIAQQEWIHQFRYISPAILLQNSLSSLAETSTSHYEAYRKQVIYFADEWKAFFVPLVFRGEQITAHMMKTLPSFTYQSEEVPTYFTNNIGALFTYCLIMLVLSYVVFMRLIKEKLILMSN